MLTDSATSGKLEWSLVSATGTYVRDPVPNCPTINDEKWHHGFVRHAHNSDGLRVVGVAHKTMLFQLD